MIIYDGQSRLGGGRILGIVTGVDKDSANTKTGPMAQLYILGAKEPPTTALHTGSDKTICGDCKHRPVVSGGLGSCYVVVAQGPAGIYRAWKKNRYKKFHPGIVNAAIRLAGQNIRLGAYGDPAALPLDTLHYLTDGLRFTGYTHQWKTCDPEYKRFCMASVDTPQEYVKAKSMGWRTFRVRLENEILAKGEIMCPASEEMGHRTTCDRCVLCMGTTIKAKDIAIVVHGQHTRKFIELRSV